jgi:hypothetical protein
MHRYKQAHNNVCPVATETHCLQQYKTNGREHTVSTTCVSVFTVLTNSCVITDINHNNSETVVTQLLRVLTFTIPGYIR